MSEISLQLASAIYERKFAWKVVIDLLSSLEYFRIKFIIHKIPSNYYKSQLTLNHRSKDKDKLMEW